MIINNISKYFYITKSIAQLRNLYNLKMCYKSHLNHLKYKTNFSLSLSNRLTINSNYYRSFKDLQYFYILYLRSNFSKTSKLLEYRFKSFNNYYFINNYKQYLALNDINRVITWRLLQLNSIFKIYISLKKKKKKLLYTSRLKFINQKYRILISWTWLKYFIKSYSDKSNLKKLHYTLDNFFTMPEQKHVLTDIKFSVYKLQLLRSL